MTDRLHGMLHQVTQRLTSSSGRSYNIDPTLTSGELFGELVERGWQLTRGIVHGNGFIFRGERTRVRGRRNFRLARGVFIGAGSILDARGSRGIRMAAASRLGRMGIVTTTSHLSRRGVGLEIGAGSGVGDFFHIGASGGVKIGRDVIIGPYLLVHSQEHNYADPKQLIREQGTREAEVIIGDDCWIGSRVTLLAGTKLGPRTIVAAGAVVRGVFEGGVILAGVPAQVVKAI